MKKLFVYVIFYPTVCWGIVVSANVQYVKPFVVPELKEWRYLSVIEDRQ